MQTLRLEVANQNLLLHLFEEYYDASGKAQGNPLISSYWRDRAELFQVYEDDRQELKLALTDDFGSKWKGPLHRLEDTTCMLSHLGHLEHRLDVFRLSRTARKVCHRMGLDFTFQVFRQVCAIELIQRHLPSELRASVCAY